MWHVVLGKQVSACDWIGLVRLILSRQDVRKCAASETCSVGQVPALNPAKHRLGSTERALSYVNAQDLPPAFTLWSSYLPLRKLNSSVWRGALLIIVV